MLESLFRSALVRRRMAAVHLSIILEGFVLHLERRGHVLTCIQSYAQIAEHFFHWLGDQHIGLKQIDNPVVERFVIEHLPRCKCPKPAPTCERNCRAALGRLLDFLRHQELIPYAPSPGIPALDHLVQDYDQYLRDVHGLSEATRLYRIRYARLFLQTMISAERPSLRALISADMLGYIKRRAAGLKPSSLAVLTTSLRSFLRFLQVTGRVKKGEVSPVLRPAPWPRSPLPAVMSAEQYQAFMRGFDRTTAVGLRDYAMAMCLSELGLRTHEVSILALNDLDWSRSILHLRETKQRRERLMPLPQIVARAISAYFRHGRPVSLSGALFVRNRAPLGQSLKVHHVRGAMRRAMRRAGLPSARVHLLRHSFATRLHQKGVGLKAIADLLGHQTLDTTASYARVDVGELREAALPWPEDWR